jgi:hypothetical protein
METVAAALTKRRFSVPTDYRPVFVIAFENLASLYQKHSPLSSPFDKKISKVCN